MASRSADNTAQGEGDTAPCRHHAVACWRGVLLALPLSLGLWGLLIGGLWLMFGR